MSWSGIESNCSCATIENVSWDGKEPIKRKGVTLGLDVDPKVASTMNGKSKKQKTNRINKMRIGKFRLLLAAFPCLLAGLSAQANLVVNGGFESGSLSPWFGANASVTSVPADVHSGTFAGQIGNVPGAPGGVGSLEQVVPITGGSTYIVDFWAKTDVSGSGVLQVALDSVTVANIVLTTTYTEYTFTVTPLTVGALEFQWADGGTQNAFIDDVTLVPEPTTLVAGLLLVLPFGLSTLRNVRKTVMA